MVVGTSCATRAGRCTGWRQSISCAKTANAGYALTPPSRGLCSRESGRMVCHSTITVVLPGTS